MADGGFSNVCWNILMASEYVMQTIFWMRYREIQRSQSGMHVSKKPSFSSSPDFHLLEVAGRGSEMQLQMGENYRW